MAEGEEVAKDKGGGGGGGECLGCPPAVVVQGSGSQDRPWESGPAVPGLPVGLASSLPGLAVRCQG